MPKRVALAVSAILLGIALGCSDAAPVGSAVPPADGGHPLVLVDAARDPEPFDAGEPPDADAGADAEPIDLAPYRIVGRFDARSAAGPRFGWPGTQVRARFSGTAISVELADTGKDQYDVAIDGEPPRLLLVSGGRKTYALGKDLVAGVHEVVLTKRTESAVGITQLFGFDAPLVGTPLPGRRRIEMVGDSITCGYGVLGANAMCTFSAETESETFAWGALAATALAATHTAIAWSGIGVYRNFEGTTAGTMPTRYALALATDPASTWAPADYDPDVVVVNLGTNDFAKGDPGMPYQSAYLAFLVTIRTAHPNAQIVVSSSPMLGSTARTKQQTYLQNVIAARAMAGDTRLSFLDLDEQSPADGLGCDSHPSKVTQQKMAARLVAHVKTLTGW